jgi:hypothetical protein
MGDAEADPCHFGLEMGKLFASFEPVQIEYEKTIELEHAMDV